MYIHIQQLINLSIKFQIEQILVVKERVYVLVKHFNSDIEFTLTDSSLLGEVPIENWMDIPSATDKDGNPRNDYYAFVLKKIK